LCFSSCCVFNKKALVGQEQTHLLISNSNNDEFKKPSNKNAQKQLSSQSSLQQNKPDCSVYVQKKLQVKNTLAYLFKAQMINRKLYIFATC
jgi:hypothetical protein